MTTVLDIVRDAYRESDLIAIGEVPSAAQLEEGLTLLNRLRLSVLGTEAGDELSPIVIGRGNIDRPTGFPWYDGAPPVTDWFAPGNSRLYLNLTAAQTIYLDPNPQDGARFAFNDMSNNLSTYNLTLDANGRLIGGATSATVNTNGAAREYFYRADTGNWAQVSPLESTDTWPFPEEFDDFFVVGLALRLNPRHVVGTAPESVEAYKRGKRQFVARYKFTKEVGSELGLIRTAGNCNRYYDLGYGGPFANSAFNYGFGWPWGIRY